MINLMIIQQFEMRQNVVITGLNIFNQKKKKNKNETNKNGDKQKSYKIFCASFAFRLDEKFQFTFNECSSEQSMNYLIYGYFPLINFFLLIAKVLLRIY